MSHKTWKIAKFERYIFVILLSVEMIMSFTFLGYFHIPPISATTAYIPIVVIACLFGPGEATIAGLFFGLGSMFKASALYVMADDRLFSPFRSGSPVKSLLLSVGMRVLFGFVIGWLYRFVKSGKLCLLWKSLLAFFAPRLHAFLVYGAIGVFFPESGLDFRTAFQLSRSAVFSSVLCLLCVLLCDRFYRSRYLSGYRNAIDAVGGKSGWSMKITVFLGAITVFIVCIAVASTVYFSDRTRYMLAAHGVAVSDAVQSDILHLQTQFLLSVLFLCLILLLVILMVYQYMKYREYIGEMDALTEVMGRRLFLNYCGECQRDRKIGSCRDGWFLFLDVDHFKSINDTLGHSIGDDTLRRVAAALRQRFQNFGAVGRVGGDEFAVIIEKELTEENLSELLNGFLSEIAGILPERTVSCSIGAYRFIFPQEVSELLSQTDRALYQAKEAGRARFVIFDGTAAQNSRPHPGAASHKQAKR